MLHISGLKGELVVQGTTLLYVQASNFTLQDSSLIGPLGIGVLMIVSGFAQISNVTFSFTQGRTIVKTLLGDSFTFQEFDLSDVVLSQPIFTMSSGSTGHNRDLSLRNVNSIALAKGLAYRLHAESLLVTNYSIDSIVLFRLMCK